jgi:hypothetical protein
MATAFRSDSDVTNGTAGTAVTVNKPSGTTDGDCLIAYIAAAGAPTITPPAGWDLVPSTPVASGSNVTLWAYSKIASSEGASWTWTLGTSLRNWGWVGAYTGVDPDDPVYEPALGGGQGGESDTTLDSSTTLITGTSSTPASMAVSAAAAVRTASGSATTWTFSEFNGIATNERTDLSTNAGAGTDIAGVVGDLQWPESYGTLVFPDSVASQSQTAGAAYVLVLRPYFTPFDGDLLGGGIAVDAAFGADPDGDQDDWTWTDLAILGLVAEDEQVVIKSGRPNGTSTCDPIEIELTLKDLNGEFTSPSGTYTENLVRNLPMRIRLTGFGVGATDGYHRGTAYLAEAKPRWDTSGNAAFVDVVLKGRSWRTQRDSDTTGPLHSAGYRRMIGLGNDPDALAPVAYWSFEDQSGATSAAAAIDGVANAAVAGVTFSANNSLYVGSESLATFTATSAVSAPIPTYAATDHWAVIWAESIPSEPAAQTVLAFVTTTGTARRWRLSISPGTSALVLDVFDSTGTSLLSTNVTFTDVYGQPTLFAVAATRNGTGIDYQAVVLTASGSTGVTGTLAGQTAGNGTLFQTVYDAGVNGATFGHLGVYTDPDYEIGGFSGTFAADALILGNAGEWPWSRFQRLCTEEGINHTFEQSTSTELTMGPQGTDTLINLLRECEQAENVAMHDAGTLGAQTGLLNLPAHEERDNAEVVLTLDIASGEVTGGFVPSLDDQDIVNDAEVIRDGGSSARVTDDASIAVEKRYPRQYTVSTEDDSMLRHMASQRVNEGTAGHQVGVMRMPTVAFNLRKSTGLTEDWLACRLGSKVRIQNPPSQWPPDDIDCFIEGYEERISSRSWGVALNLSPADAFGVFLLAETSSDAGEWVGRLAEDEGARIRAAINDSTTSIDFDPNRYRWTTTADDFDPDPVIRIGNMARVKETVTVSSIATTAATYVAAGAASHADNAAVTPALYAGGAANDLILVLARIRSSAGTLATPTGYTRLPVNNLTASSTIQLYAKVHSGSESNPTVTPSGGSAGDTVSAVTFGFRGMPCTLPDLADIVVDSWGQSNSSAQNIAYPGLYPRLQEGCVVLAIGGKDDDWTSVATLSGFAEAVDASTTTGNDQGLVVDYVIQTTPAVVNESSFTVTGGASAVSHGITIALAGGYQTLTVSARSYNGVTKSHSAGTKIGVDHPHVLGM